MRSKNLLLVSLLLILLSCNPKGKGIDKKDVIERDRMIKLMADMQITEVALRQKQSLLNHDTMKIISNKAYDSLYLFYKTTPKSFQASLKYYQNDLEDYLKMNEEVINLLTQKEDSIKQVKDSTDKKEPSPDTAITDKSEKVSESAVKKPAQKQPERVVIDVNRKPPQRK